MKTYRVTWHEDHYCEGYVAANSPEAAISQVHRDPSTIDSDPQFLHVVDGSVTAEEFQG